MLQLEVLDFEARSERLSAESSSLYHNLAGFEMFCTALEVGGLVISEIRVEERLLDQKTMTISEDQIDFTLRINDLPWSSALYIHLLVVVDFPVA